jgi:serine acetyltransferase
MTCPEDWGSTGSVHIYGTGKLLTGVGGGSAATGADACGFAPSNLGSRTGNPVVIAAFRDDAERDPSSLISLILSDYVAACRRSKKESALRRALMFLPRLLYHAPLQATLLVRLALGGPRWLFGFWRNVLIAKHSIDVEGPVEIGPGLLLPHPVSIVIGRSTTIGANVQIMNDVTIGARPYVHGEDGRICPEIRDGAVLMTQSIVIGPITIGENALIGARTWIDKDVSAETMVRGEQSHVVRARRVEKPLPTL